MVELKDTTLYRPAPHGAVTENQAARAGAAFLAPWGENKTQRPWGPNAAYNEARSPTASGARCRLFQATKLARAH